MMWMMVAMMTMAHHRDDDEVAAVVALVVANARWAMSSIWSNWLSLVNDLLRWVDYLYLRRSFF